MQQRLAPEVRGTSLFVTAAVAFALSAAIGAQSVACADDLQRWSGAAPPSFTLSDTAGADVSLDSERGHIVLVHFFATWCETCREELPALNRMVARGGGKVKVLAISVGEVDLRVRRFIETTPVSYPVLLDRELAIAKTWNVSTLPTTFVLGADLRPRFLIETDFAWDSLDPGKLPGMLAAGASGSTAIEDLAKLVHRGG